MRIFWVEILKICVMMVKIKSALRGSGAIPGLFFVMDSGIEHAGGWVWGTRAVLLPFFTPGRCHSMANKRNRPDKDGPHRLAFERNKKKIYATQTICGICGKSVDFSLRYPHPLSPCIDHIIPIAKGGHPSDIENMQLAHWTCNRMKSDKIIPRGGAVQQSEVISNRVLPHSRNWTTYRGGTS